MPARSTSVVSILLLAAYVATTASAQPLRPIGDVAGWDDTIVTDVSDDGEVVIGFVRNYGDRTSWSQAFRWEDGEITLLGLLPGHGTSEAYDLSADGSVVIGKSCEVDGFARDCRAVRWSGTVAVELPFDDPENDSAHEAYAVSADGSIIAGFLYGWDINGTVRWAGNQAPARATSSFLWAWPHGMSSDGSVIVASTSVPQPGDLFDYGSDELYRISGQTVSPLPLPAGRSNGAVFGVSGDGSVAVGSYRTETQNSRPIYWGPDGVEELPLPDSAIGGMATVVSQDGSVIAGEYMLEGFERYVAVWRDGVFSDLEQELAARGVDLAGDFLSTPGGISADGTVIVGRGRVDGLRGYRAELGGLVVNDDGDESDANPGDGECDVDLNADGAQCTLRAVLEEANALEGQDLVTFRLDGEGPFVISPNSPLPAITEGIVLNGASQPGTSEVPVVRIHGAQAGEETSGFTVNADDVTIRGLMITGFSGHGIHVVGGANGVLEGLIVGSDAAGSSGLGNVGDGIRVSGGSGLRIGSEEETAGKTSAINLGVSVLGNALNGLYAVDATNAKRIAAGKAGTAAVPAISLNLNVSNLSVGLLETLNGISALPNGLNGICLNGVRDAVFDHIVVSDAIQHAFEAISSQQIVIRRALMGLRSPTLQGTLDVGSIGGSVFRLVQSLGITLGSDDPADAPIQGGGAEGWFVEIDDSEDVDVRNILGGITENIEGISEAARTALRNLSGGMLIQNAPNVRVGMIGVPTVFANNGGDDEKPQAGIFAHGSSTRLLRMLNVHLGTTPEGLAGLGNLGNGLVLSEGIREALLGGESEEEQVVSAGNGGTGFLFRQLPATGGGPLGGVVGNVLTATRLVSDLIKTDGGRIVKLPNQGSGIRLEEVEDVRLVALSIGPALQNGIEIIESIQIELESAMVGMYWKQLADGLDDIAGPAGDGVVIEGGEDIAVGRRLYEEFVTTGYLVHVVGAGGRALFAHRTARLKLANWAAGLDMEGSDESDAIFEALGNELEASVIEESEDVEIENAAFMSNGAGASSGTGGLLINLSQNVRVIASLFGELTADGQPRRPNFHSALKALDSQGVRLALSRVVGHPVGLIAERSAVTLDGNVFAMQGSLSGVGDAVRAIQASVVHASRNVILENEGAGFWFVDDSGGLLRHNDIVDNGMGVSVEATGNKSARSNGTVSAPDNWWGDASGPGGAGPGSGDAISDGVQASTWLSSPTGVVVAPESYVVEAWALSDVSIPVYFASPFVENDVLDVTVIDEKGWITSAQSFELEMPAHGGVTATVEATLTSGGASRVTIEAVSQSDPTYRGEATVVIARPGTLVPLGTEAQAGSTVLDAPGEEAFVVGGEIVLNPGGANEETAEIVGFGSILLRNPLRFDHAAGEPIAPANRLSVGREDEADALPHALEVQAYPNPAASHFTLSLLLPETGAVRSEVFDIVGRRVALLHDGVLGAGRQEVRLDVSGWPSGVYLVRTTTASGTVASRLVVTR